MTNYDVVIDIDVRGTCIDSSYMRITTHSSNSWRKFDPNQAMRLRDLGTEENIK